MQKMQQLYGSRYGLALGSGVVGEAEGLAFSGGAFPPQSSDSLKCFAGASQGRRYGLLYLLP